MEGLLDEYYEPRGWNKGTGVPTREKSVEPGLDDVADELSRLGRIYAFLTLAIEDYAMILRERFGPREAGAQVAP